MIAAYERLKAIANNEQPTVQRSHRIVPVADLETVLQAYRREVLRRERKK